MPVSLIAGKSWHSLTDGLVDANTFREVWLSDLSKWGDTIQHAWK
jgi:hypothetical protein